MSQVNQYLDSLKSVVAEIEVREVIDELSKGAVLIDIREIDEVKSGLPSQAMHITKGMLEMKIGNIVPDINSSIFLMCQSGKRSLLAAKNLIDIGYTNVKSVEGGFAKWKNSGFPFEIPHFLSEDARQRYMRNMLIPEIGEKGQAKLLKSSVLVVGAGGIGSSLLFYLAAAGVGNIGIIDSDVVDRTNLQRQIIHTDAAVGSSKVESAKSRLLELNPTIKINAYNERLNSENIEEIITEYDILIDGTDNFTTRYLINDACVKFKKPNIHGSVFLFEGQFTTYWPAYNHSAPCYRCLFPSPPPKELAPNCAEAGVMGVLPGLIGLLCATEAINIILGFDNMTSKLMVVNSKPISFSQLNIKKDPNCLYCNCTDQSKYPPYIDYETFCSM
ncbi:molybdopterin/thiamine biosynthesis adenylyltransferase/rhodanese-related sulfurtransferase [Sphingobacterium zeae]|uniref:Molybdopterin/thiamine biosynthesis adenylyltransferase/rhodanese-related sulfurtransferase n=1 Tax=Sphingobacterium zeae TaxID=1776859 RepID=A0ABU0UC06_9SPHI|nr:molybdopterin-synthase adenylyltransferase MoeB [Sphingobacterium zeae]MDQ1152380.1 molybdopterin/thiamine biosynthesis adenylyltransferase/rhodanese-related sulfurtransferase [Sphingobacterium zeae]